MIENVRIIIAICIFIIFSIFCYFYKLFFTKISDQKNKNDFLKREHYNNIQKKYDKINNKFKQIEIYKNDSLKRKHYDNIQKKQDKIKYNKIITKKQDSFHEFRKMLD